MPDITVEVANRDISGSFPLPASIAPNARHLLLTTEFFVLFVPRVLFVCWFFFLINNESLQHAFSGT